ncbi:hypothetical protein TH62_05190 [Bacillus sp. TH008]|nr:DoxX family protein [Bacillus glycinifermentans]KKB74795.1 hypothetical protein TH62_05190 [Bacillus sp. TH008]
MKACLAAFMFTGGVIKILHVPFQVEHWRHYQYPLWFLTVTGCLEIAGALIMAWGIWNPNLAVAAGILFFLLMMGAIHAHIFRARQSVFTAIPAAICSIASVIIVLLELNAGF